MLSPLGAITLRIAVLSIVLSLTVAAQARDRVNIGIGLGINPYWGGYPYTYYYDRPYAYYPPPVYFSPSPVYYAHPIPAPRFQPPERSAGVVATPINVTVVRVQDALRTRKYYSGIVDGLNGPETERAIRSYQRDRNLPVTGKIEPLLTEDLGL